jgi:hypothetical protein
MASKTEWAGTSSDLLSLLTRQIGEQAAKEQNWPRRANLLSGKLRRAAPALRKTGVHITFERGGHASTRTIKIVARSKSEQSGKSSSAASASSASEQKLSGSDHVGAGAEDDAPTKANAPQTMAADTTVCTNSLEDNDGDDADIADDDLRSFMGNRNVLSEAIYEGLRAGSEPGSAPVPDAAHRCDLCGGVSDHQPLCLVGDGERTARLHSRCEGAWLQKATREALATLEDPK